ncbi:Na/Pi cotransporter family protein [Selenihalanaerobacter shriftii]|uniref:Phosphate:Na+ symporter n=1 Tax=Selenihalanaerobacter shriftii TaxID=142842 RepID=A0A1T4JN51_9FIRM|nr:Na/Pi symporter [Selenihalanaerobacter shriftii]SJZ31589.1 phosphate:Na+ symporter [Selenihalanaerobacter shriftii]
MLLTILYLISGLIIFIYGMHVVKVGLQDRVNTQSRYLLKYITGTKLLSILSGILVTALMQSSSATIVLIISFVNAELLGLAQALGMIIGTNIGTTITGQIISFNLEDNFWLFFLIGLVFYLIYRIYNRQKNKWLILAKTFIGFGLIFLGLNFLGDALTPLKDTEFFLKFIINLSHNNFLALLSGTLGTSILQSSSAFIGVILTLSKEGLIQLPTAILLLLGSNIGTCITAVIASVNGSLKAIQVAVGHIIFNLLGVIFFYPLVTPFSYLVALTSNQIVRQIANGHTIFNLINAVLFYFFFDKFIEIVKKISE